jgi:uncharacterized membrane protein YdjX (TVP38/TMEM64 family)
MQLRSNNLAKLVAGTFAFFLVVYLLLESTFGLSARLEFSLLHLQKSWEAALVIYFLLILDILIPIPSSIVMVLSGTLFGWFVGGLITIIGSLSSAYLNFFVSRALVRKKALATLKPTELNYLTRLKESQGESIILLTRMIPLVSETISSLAGIVGMNTKRFVLLNFIGFLPVTFFYSFVGEHFKDSPTSIMGFLIFGFVAPLVIWRVFVKK